MNFKYLKILLSAFLFLTLNFGQAQLTWQLLTTGTSAKLYDSYFVDANKGWAVGDNGTIIRTLNGGSSWTNLTSGVSSKLNGTHFVNSLNGWAVGNGIVIKTTNGGNNWTDETFSTNETFNDIFFIDETTGWIVGATPSNTSIIYKTEDGGITWSVVGNSLFYGVESIDFISPSYGMAVTYSTAFFTIDGGDNWVSMPIPTTATLTRVEMFSASTGWITGTGGLVMKTTNGGSLWTIQTTPATDVLNDISTFNGVDLYAVGLSNTLITTNNGGAYWDFNSSLSASDSLFSVFSVNQSTHYITGVNGIMFKSIANYDLNIDEYLSSPVVCANQDFPVKIVLKSNGPTNATEATIVVLQGTQPILTYNWTGNLGPGTVETVNLGMISIANDQSLTIVITGDNDNSNNTFIHPLAVFDEPAAGTNDFIRACIGDNIQLQAFGGQTYQWYNASPDSTSQNQNLVANYSTTYFVDIKQNQCTVFDSVVVEIDIDCSTNAFSPNGDSVNDSFVIGGLSGAANTVTIYNRWGDEIVVFKNYDNTTVVWDGVDGNGRSVTEGTYYYVVESADANSISGWVQLVR